jgi:hypothetical protein
MSREPFKWYDPSADNRPWIRALADVRHMAAREGYCFHREQAIIVSIDQCAEAALDNRGLLPEQALRHRWTER